MAEVEKVDRGARRKARTRQKLLDAAGSLFAQSSLDDISIVDITDAADVGLGTFYNHFESKNDLLKAVADDFLLVYAEELDKLIEDLTDPMEIILMSYRYTIRSAKHPIGWPIIEQLPQNYLRDKIHARAVADAVVGVKTGRFKLDDAEAFMKFMSSSVVGVMGGLADDTLTLEEAEAFGIYFAKLLGVDEAAAAEFLARPMPKI